MFKIMARMAGEKDYSPLVSGAEGLFTKDEIEEFKLSDDLYYNEIGECWLTRLPEPAMFKMHFRFEPVMVAY